MGVLQRFAVGYLVVGTMRVFTQANVQQMQERHNTLMVRGVGKHLIIKMRLSFQDLSGLLRIVAACTIELWTYWLEWVIMGVLVLVWCCFTFLLPVPGCPT